MKIIVHSTFDAVSIQSGLGRSEYSYYFVLAGFLPALERLGTVLRVDAPEDADEIYDHCLAAGEACVFLCFAPPHLVPVSLRCPTIPVIAWEFTTLPTEAYGDDPRSDWRVVFRHCGRVIALSGHTAKLVQAAMGDDFTVFAIPTATYDRFAPLATALDLGPRQVTIRGFVFDSASETRFQEQPLWPPASIQGIVIPVPPAGVLVPEPEPVALAPEPEPEPLAPARRGARAKFSLTAHYAVAWYRDVLRDMLPGPLIVLVSWIGRTMHRSYRLAVPEPAPIPEPIPEPAAAAAPQQPVWPEISVTLQDVVYVSVLSPIDGRKNWHDLLGAFVWEFRDNPRATLVLKMPLVGGVEQYPHMNFTLARFAPFQCRVIFLIGFLDDAQYAALLGAATYYVNTSFCEGLCLPLMEFLSAGKPAVAPNHTAMADYITPNLAFMLRGSLEHNVWPHDPRDLFSTMRYRLNWETITAAYAASFQIATANDGAYAAMSAAASQRMQKFCGIEPVTAQLALALASLAPAASVSEIAEALA
jgi:glycosyltransferase involved in cell wall biosynthesis